ncbi:MAG: helix-turn-helix domain-containing protein [candidate division WOR-3 bacterium]
MKLYLTKEEKDKIKNLGFLKVSQVAYFLGVSPRTIQRLIREKKIKASVFRFYKKKTFIIDAKEVIRFIDNFKNMLSPFSPK